MKRAMTLIVILIASITKPTIGAGSDGVVDQGDGNWTIISSPDSGGGPHIIIGPLGPHTNKVIGAGAGIGIKGGTTTRLEQLQCDIYIRSDYVEICTIMDNDGDIQRTGIAWICPAEQDCYFRDIDDAEGVIAKLQPGVIFVPGMGGGPF